MSVEYDTIPNGLGEVVIKYLIRAPQHVIFQSNFKTTRRDSLTDDREICQTESTINCLNYLKSCLKIGCTIKKKNGIYTKYYTFCQSVIFIMLI